MSLIPRRRKSDRQPEVNEWQAEITRLERQVATLKALQQVASSLTSELNLNQLLTKLLQSAIEVMHSTAGSLLLFDPATDELVFQVVQGGAGEALRNKRFPINQGIAGSVFTQHKPAIVNDVQQDERFLRIGESNHFSTVSLIAAPLMHKGNPIGVIEVLNKKSGEPYDLDDQDALSAFAAQSAIAIENARLYQQVVAERDRALLIEEQVRRELARELHDGPSQLLSSISMNLRFLREVLIRMPERAREELDDLEQLSNQALGQIRNMLFNLRPVLLESEGLSAALRSYIDRQRETKDIDFALEIDSFEARLPSKTEAAIFSIIQEAVANARLHASPTHIRVALRRKRGILTILIEDDGCGFDLKTIEERYAQRGRLGLLNMKERAEIANAKLTIDSRPGSGTRIKMVLPLAEPDQD